MLVESGLVTDRTTIATSVHELQMPDAGLPESPRDFHADLIATPKRITWCNHPRQPNCLAFTKPATFDKAMTRRNANAYGDVRHAMARAARLLITWRRKTRGELAHNPDPALRAVYGATTQEIASRTGEKWTGGDAA